MEKDTGWVGRIRTQLEALGRSVEIEIWDDSKIQSGTKWNQETNAIRHSRVAVLVLTADFLASRYMHESELPLFLEAAEVDGAKIFCLYGSAVHLSGSLERLSAYEVVNDPKEPLPAMTEARREVTFAELSRLVCERIP